MNIRFLILFFCFIQSTPFARAQDAPDFNSALSRAMIIASRGNYDQAETLLRTHSDEWMVYDAYTRVLESDGRFDRAREIYEKAKKRFSARQEEINARLSGLKDVETFRSAMKEAPDWKRAKTYTNTFSLVKTNIPDPYRRQLLDKINELFDKEKLMLDRIFETKAALISPVKIYAFGNWDDLAAHYQEPVSPDDFYAVYVPAKQEILIYFNGYQDWKGVAHEMCHFLVRQYVPEPSLFLDEGMATYVSAKLEKESSKDIWLNSLEWINWAYDQGRLQQASEFLQYWHDYANPVNRQMYFAARKHFYMTAWTLTAFLLEGNDPDYTAFFKKYLRYEKKNKLNDYTSVRKFFEKNLSQTQREKMDVAWSRFFLSLTFDKI